MNISNEKKKQIVKDDYNAIAEIYASSYCDIDYCMPYIDEFIASLTGNDVLDVGCGAGQITDYLTQKGINAVGIDFSEELLKIAKKNFPKSKFLLADISQYNQEGKLDGIITKDVLFHLSDEDLVKTLATFKKILKPQGSVCIIMDMPKEAGEQIFVEELDVRYQIYYNYLTPDKLKGLLEKTGLTVDKLYIVGENEHAATYATGLMVFHASNK